MTFYYNFHGDGPRLIISNLFINTEFPERDTWREHSVTRKSRRKWNFEKD